MIHIDRSKISVPEILNSDKTQKLYESAKEHFHSKEGDTGQIRYKFNLRPLRDASVKNALLELFEGKCAFCESKLSSVSQMDIEHFRPKSGAVGLEGNFYPAHYWWLVYEWRNLYSICRSCNQSKRNRFPVAASRASLETPYEDLESEQPLLIDPCLDKPGKFFVYDEQGEIVSDDRRGQITIEIFGLNRPDLVESRRTLYELLRTLWREWQKSRSKDIQKQIIGMISSKSEFSALSRQFVIQWTKKDFKSSKWGKLWDRWSNLFNTIRSDHGIVTERRRRSTKKSYRDYESRLEDYSLETEDKPESIHLLDQTIERIEIHNLRAIRDLVIDVQSTATEQSPWTLLLGENGTGKSTILQALALTLAGGSYRSTLEIDPGSYVSHRCKKGSIRVHIRGFTSPLELNFRNSGPQSSRLIGSDERPKIPVLAYGATRLLPRQDVPTYKGTRYARIDNLFNPFEPLADATDWLMGLSDQQFNHTARMLKDLLNLPPKVVLRRNKRRRRIEIPSLKVSSLNELSDGYQSMLALVADVMMVMLAHFEAIEAAQGIVLLDEIGAHLHPRWRMRVVKSLRDAFPNIQFIASTHDPLCLRGIEDGEVAVLKKGPNDRVFSVTDLPSISGMRVDQLLTSEHFGLSSTVDPELEEIFERYYELLKEPNGEDSAEFDELRNVLEQHRVLGATRRERLMLEAIDKYLSFQNEDSSHRGENKAKLDSNLADIINDVAV